MTAVRVKDEVISVDLDYVKEKLIGIISATRIWGSLGARENLSRENKMRCQYMNRRLERDYNLFIEKYGLSHEMPLAINELTGKRCLVMNNGKLIY